MTETSKTMPQDAAPRSVVAIGNFDGVHKGHAAVIAAARAKADALAAPLTVLTFEPHPRALFKPDAPPFRLTPCAVKEQLVLSLGANRMAVEAFTRDFAALSAEAFIETVLLRKLNACHIVTGTDFVFGHGRAGHVELLRAVLEPRGIGVTAVPGLRDDNGEVYSSTRVRDALRKGDVATAAAMLGRSWSLTGRVIQGAQKGRTLGFPTANIALDELIRPAYGVYAVTVRRPDASRTDHGVANIGLRPTVDGATELLEVHLFDSVGDFYGQLWEVTPHSFLRPEQKFDSLDALRHAIEHDSRTARAVLGQR